MTDLFSRVFFRLACFAIPLVVVVLPHSLTWFAAQPVRAAEPSTVPAGLILDQVFDGVKARAQTLDRIEADFQSEWLPLGVNPGEGWIQSFSVAFAGEKIRYTLEREETGSRRFNTYAWNGTKLNTLVEQHGIRADRRFAGLIAGDRGQGAVLGSLNWRTFLGRATLRIDAPLHDVLDTVEWEDLGQRTIGGEIARGFANRGPIAKAEVPESRFEFWIVPAQDFACIEMSSVEMKDGKLVAEYRYVVDQFMTFDEVPVPSKATVKYFVDHLPPEEGGKAEYRFTLTRLAVKRQISDDTFSIKFPFGTGVADDITKLSFVAGVSVLIGDGDNGYRYVPISDYPDYLAQTDFTRGVSKEEWAATEYGRNILSELGEKVGPATTRAIGTFTSQEVATTRNADALTEEERAGSDFLRWVVVASIAVAGALLLCWRWAAAQRQS